MVYYFQGQSSPEIDTKFGNKISPDAYVEHTRSILLRQYY